MPKDSSSIKIKSKFDAEYRRCNLERNPIAKFEEFMTFIEDFHKLRNIRFHVSYIDPSDQDLHPINNDDNLRRALLNAKTLLRVIIQRVVPVPSLQSACRNAILQITSSKSVPFLPLPTLLKKYLLYQT